MHHLVNAIRKQSPVCARKLWMPSKNHVVHLNWTIDLSCLNENSITLLKFPNAIMESSWMATNEYPPKIIISLTPHSKIAIQTYGKEALFQDIKNVKDVEVSLSSIDKAMCLLELTSPCLGYLIPVSNSTVLNLPVLNSKVVVVKTDNLEAHKRLMSTSCLLVNREKKSKNVQQRVWAARRTRTVTRGTWIKWGMK